jgi:hypothetical protein
VASGAGGTCCWAAAGNTGMKRAISAAALSKRSDGRIKRFSLERDKLPLYIAYNAGLAGWV